MTSRMSFYRRAATACPWLALMLFLGFTKLVVLVFDSNPQVYLGDSMSYLATALNRWIPPDRSFLYGFLIHDVTSRARSLNSLVALQTFAGVVTSLLAAVILVRFMRVRFGIAAIVSVLLTLDPQQLLFERFVLTESLSTAFFALFLVVVLEYVRTGKIWALITSQILGIVLTAFRVTFLPMLATATVLAPFFVWGAWKAVERKPAFLRLGAHLALSAGLWFSLHTAYKNWNGSLLGLPPAYTYADGFFLIANVSPLVTPADSDNPKLIPVLARPLAYVNPSDRLSSRNTEMFAPDGLVERIKEALKDDYQANIEAKRIAYRVIRRDPLGFIQLAVQTYLLFYSKDHMKDVLRTEEGLRDLDPGELEMLSQYHLDARGLPYMKTLTRQYHLASWPLYIIVLHTPLLLLAAIPLAYESSKRFLWFLMLLITVHVAAVQVAGVEPSPRHLHAVSVLLAVAVGVLAERIWPGGNPSKSIA